MSETKYDILELGIPNVCFSCANEVEDEERRKKYKEQRLERGFDDTETWDLDYVFAKFMLPRLKRLMKVSNEIVDWSEDIEDIKKLEKALELIILEMESDDVCLLTKEQNDEVKEGLEVLPKLFRKLWW